MKHLLFALTCAQCIPLTCMMNDRAQQLLFLAISSEQSNEFIASGSSPDFRHTFTNSYIHSKSPVANSSSLLLSRGKREIEYDASSILEESERISRKENIPVIDILNAHLRKEKEGLAALCNPYVTQEQMRRLYNDPSLPFDKRNIVRYQQMTQDEIHATEFAIALHQKAIAARLPGANQK